MAERKTALVLSPGGMFGAYQAGAYQTIFEREPPDIVVGSSVGALNGWAIAGRCSPQDLIERWLQPSAGDTLKLFPNAGWRNGWFDPAPLRAQAEQLWSAYQPAIPFGLVVVALPWLKAHLIQHPDVLPAHLQATCSIPLFLPPVAVNGTRYLDGGLFEKLPIWAAIRMGATRIVAIDALPDVGERWLRVGRKVALTLKPPRRYPSSLDLTIVSPSERMGDANDAVFWKRSNIERWIRMGAEDAARAIPARDRYPVHNEIRPLSEPFPRRISSQFE